MAYGGLVATLSTLMFNDADTPTPDVSFFMS